MQVGKDFKYEFPKFQGHKLCESQNIYIQMYVVFGGRFAILHSKHSTGLCYDVVCIWIVIGQSQSVTVIVIGK